MTTARPLVELVVAELTVDQPCAELPIFVQIPKGEDDRKAEELRLRLLVRKHGPALVKAVYGWPADG